MKKLMVLLLSLFLVACSGKKTAVRDTSEIITQVSGDIRLKEESVKEDNSYIRIQEEETLKTEILLYDTTLPVDNLSGSPPVLGKKITVKTTAITYEKENDKKEENKSEVIGKVREDLQSSNYTEKEHIFEGLEDLSWIVILLTVLIIILKFSNGKSSSK